MKPINLRIAEELGVREQQVSAAISLLDGGATVPFVARYRKEAAGAVILDSIGQQGNSTPRSSRRATRRTARRGSRISICRIGRSGGRKPKSHAKRASNRWQRRF